MLLDIDKMGDGGLAFDEPLRLTRLAEESPDYVEPPTVRLHGTVHPGPDRRDPAAGALLAGTLSGAMKLRCSRCLEPLEVPLSTAFRFVLVARTPVDEEAEDGSEAARTQYFETPDGRLCLDDVAAEQVLLETPLKPLCRADCAGLCPTCGVNRNRLECACRQEDGDPRLAALKEIRDRMRES